MVNVQTGNMLDVIVDGKSIGIKQRDSDHRKYEIIWLPKPEGLRDVLVAEIDRLQAERFQFILDEVPQWWKDLTNVRIDISMPIALIPGAEPALPGDWIIREPSGLIRTESSEEGRVRAREYLTALRKEVGLL